MFAVRLGGKFFSVTLCGFQRQSIGLPELVLLVASGKSASVHRGHGIAFKEAGVGLCVYVGERKKTYSLLSNSCAVGSAGQTNGSIKWTVIFFLKAGWNRSPRA